MLNVAISKPYVKKLPIKTNMRLLSIVIPSRILKPIVSEFTLIANWRISPTLLLFMRKSHKTPLSSKAAFDKADENKHIVTK